MNNTENSILSLFLFKKLSRNQSITSDISVVTVFSIKYLLFSWIETSRDAKCKLLRTSGKLFNERVRIIPFIVYRFREEMGKLNRWKQHPLKVKLEQHWIEIEQIILYEISEIELCQDFTKYVLCALHAEWCICCMLHTLLLHTVHCTQRWFLISTRTILIQKLKPNQNRLFSRILY